MMSYILYSGVLSVLVMTLLKKISDTYRGMMCWTFSCIAFCAAAVVYFSSASSYIPDSGALIAGISGAALIGAAALAIELMAPTKRFRRRSQSDYDRRSAEDAVNIVFIIFCSACCLAVIISESLSRSEYTVIGILPAAAVSLRQLSYYLYRVKQDTLTADKNDARRLRLVRELGSGKRSL